MKLKQMLNHYATFSPDGVDGGAGDAAPPAPEATPAAEPTAPAAATFTQEQVNGLLAKERATATRKAKAAAKAPAPLPQETSTETGEPSAFQVQMAEQMAALTGLVQGTIDKQSANEGAAALATDIAGLEISATDLAVLKSLQVAAPELYATKLAEYKSADAPPAAKGPGLTEAPGAPSATPNAPDILNPVKWTRDDIATMKGSGTFRENLEKGRAALPGGRGGLFPSKR